MTSAVQTIALSSDTVIAAGDLSIRSGGLASLTFAAFDPRPSAPTGVVASAGNGQATVSFTTPAETGTADISSYIVVASGGGGATSATGTGSPIVVSGLQNGVLYTFAVRAVSGPATGPASAPSNTVPPNAPATGGQPGGGGGGGGGSNLPDLEVTQSANRAQAAVGDVVTFSSSVILKNFAASSGASNLVLTDVLPASLELVSVATNRGSCVSGQTVICNLNFIASGMTAQVAITAKVVAAGEIVNTMSVKADETELDPANNVATVRLNSPVAVPVAPLAPPTVVKKPVLVKGVTRAGTAKAETMRGTARPDTLDGRAGNDTILGLGGNDLLVGGGGRDTIDAGDGNDTVRVRDGAKDTVRCGAGTDTVIADKIDALLGCEKITRR